MSPDVFEGLWGYLKTNLNHIRRYTILDGNQDMLAELALINSEISCTVHRHCLDRQHLPLSVGFGFEGSTMAIIFFPLN